jgi:hypothetical protein
MMTAELRHIHTGIMAVADHAVFGFGVEAITGEGRDASTCRSLRGIWSAWSGLFSSCGIARKMMVNHNQSNRPDADSALLNV